MASKDTPVRRKARPKRSVNKLSIQKKYDMLPLGKEIQKPGGERVFMAKKAMNYKKIKLLILLGVGVYAAITFFNQQAIINTQLEKQDVLLAQEEDLKQDVQYNQNLLDYIGSDAYVIKEARERLGWLFDDETKYVEVPSDETDNAATDDTGAQ